MQRNHNKVVKTSKLGWLSKKLHMRGVRFSYHFGVLEYVEMIGKSQQRSRGRVFTTPSTITAENIDGNVLKFKRRGMKMPLHLEDMDIISEVDGLSSAF